MLLVVGVACIILNLVLVSIHLYVIVRGVRAADPEGPATRDPELSEEVEGGRALHVVVGIRE